MQEEVKKKTVNVEDMQSFGKVLHNKGIGSEGTCSTAAGTAAKEVTVGTTFNPVAGATLLVQFQYAITVADATLAVTYGASGSQTTLAAKPIYYRGAALGANLVKAGATLLLRYDGTNFNIVGDLDTDTTYTPEKLGNGIGTCSTAAATAAKEVILQDYELVKNGFVAVTFSYDVPANATLNINSKGAKPIYYQGAAITAGVIKAGDTVTFCYDGTNYVISSFGGGGGSFNPEYEHIYDAVTSTTGKNPAQEGWYEIVSGAYVLTEDTTPQSGKTYYIQQDYYEMII